MTIPRIEGFDITTWVRETSTGVIWRAHQRSLDRPVLLHILKAGVDASLRNAFERNARLVARIDAPGLVGVHDVSTTSDGLPFATLENGDQWDVEAKAVGGGISGQMGALRLGIARALVQTNEEFRSALRAKGLLTRDSRAVERKKYGHKKARKSFQFSKR